MPPLNVSKKDVQIQCTKNDVQNDVQKHVQTDDKTDVLYRYTDSGR